MRRACAALPCSVIGKPSKVVAIAAGVPGMFNRIAGIAPPYIDPLYSPAMRPRATNGLRPKDSGIRIARPMVVVRPGSAPMTIPTNVPTIMASRLSHAVSAMAAPIRSSITSHLR